MNSIEQKDIELQDKIDNYLRSELNQTDRNVFEKQIITDSNLRMKVETQKLISEEIKNRAAFNLIVNGVIKKDKKRIQFKRAMAISWSAAAIFIGVFFVNQTIMNNRMDSQFTINYSAPVAKIMRSGESNPQELEFLNATKLIAKQPEQALTALLKLYTYPYTYSYYEDVRWYLALTELKLHHKSEVKKYLNELVDSEFYGEKAKKVLEKL